MTALITPENIVDIVFNRKIQSLQFKESEIEVAQYLYFRDVFGGDFADAVETTPVDYEAFLTKYVNPVIAYGTVVHSFNRIWLDITDRGINQFQNQGSTQPSPEDRQRLLHEYDRSLQVKIQLMVEYVEAQQESNNADYVEADINPKWQNYHKVQTFGKTYKVTHV